MRDELIRDYPGHRARLQELTGKLWPALDELTEAAELKRDVDEAVRSYADEVLSRIEDRRQSVRDQLERMERQQEQDKERYRKLVKAAALGSKVDQEELTRLEASISLYDARREATEAALRDIRATKEERERIRTIPEQLGGGNMYWTLRDKMDRTAALAAQIRSEAEKLKYNSDFLNLYYELTRQPLSESEWALFQEPQKPVEELPCEFDD